MSAIMSSVAPRVFGVFVVWAGTVMVVALAT